MIFAKNLKFVLHSLFLSNYGFENKFGDVQDIPIIDLIYSRNSIFPKGFTHGRFTLIRVEMASEFLRCELHVLSLVAFLNPTY